ncbi:MAG: ATP-binding protein, partial [Planctomycetota bacterium]
ESVARLHRFHHQPGEKWSLAIELPEFAREIEGNKNQLLQALLNLVRNAEDAVRDLPLDRKELRLRVEAERDVVHFSVIDRGPGVPEELRSRLFDPFYSTKAAGAGTGLGLSVVQSIAHQ